jgi:aminoglycoside phosphotransferase (APT) family kinase protein
MAAVHRIDWQKLGLDFLGRPDSPRSAMEAQLAYWNDYFSWARGNTPVPQIETALAWLGSNLPTPKRSALCWGDARLSNLIFLDGRVSAVLDWEMAFIGDPEADLAWWLFFDWHHSEGCELPRLEGLPGRDASVARWESLTGLRADNLFYYDIFATTRFGCIMIRVAETMEAKGFPLPTADLGSNNACTRRLAELLG